MHQGDTQARDRLDRRIGGLEKAERQRRSFKKLDRRIGGLEKE